MSKLVDFPQRQHEEFTHLVHDAVKNAAKVRNMSIEDYIQKIYYQGENPVAFNQPHILSKLYKQYQSLIESTIKSVDNVSVMKKSNKAYLCYRIYLHGMTIERKIMSEADSRKYLITALREFFYARGKVLSVRDEVNLLNSLSLITEQAAPLVF